MRYLILITAMALGLSASLPAQAAQDLSGEDVKRFVASLDEVQALTQDMKEEGKDEIMKTKVEPMGDDFTPYTKATQTLKSEFPGDYKKLDSITDNHGFSTPESWANTGDMIMKAYISSKITPEQKQSMAMAKTQMTPEMMAQMPPATRAQMEKSMKMMKSFEDVPQSHIEAVAPYAAEIESKIESKKAE